MIGALAGLAGGILGGIAGGQGSTTSQSYVKDVAPEGALEKQGGQAQSDLLKQLQQLLKSGPGQQDVSAGVDSQRSLAALLQSFSQSGGLPEAQDIQQAGAYTQNLFAPQQQQLAQNFQDASVGANRQAALMGRAPNDPILANKLRQEQTRQQQTLGSQMTSFQAQQAQQMPLQRLGFAQQLAQVNGNLASQAMANRQALFGMGTQLKSQEQNFRLGSAGGTQTTNSGGGMGGMLNGAIAGAGAFAGAAPGIQSAFSGFGNMFSSSPSTPSEVDAGMGGGRIGPTMAR